MGLASLLQERREISLSVMDGNIRREEPDTPGCIRIKELPNPATEYSTNQNIRVENDHFSELRSCRADASP